MLGGNRESLDTVGSRLAHRRDRHHRGDGRLRHRGGGGRRHGRVALTDRQVLINQRISQAAVRRANGLVALARGGLTGAQFRDGSIGAAGIAPRLR
jgi:hypothetical protein